jgi:transcriptional regulator with XRE-family HTH domain
MERETMNLFSRNLKHYRRQLGLSQKKLAEATCISYKSIGAYEEGRAEPNIDKLIVIASTLKVSIDKLCVYE